MANSVLSCFGTRNHFLHYRKPTSTFQRRRMPIFLKNISFVSLSRFINHLYHVREVCVPVPATAICVVASPLFISANISKPI